MMQRNELGRFVKGMKPQNRKFKLTREKLHDLYWNKKMSCIDIAKQEHVDRALVRRWMNRFNIPRRSLSEASKLKIGEKNGFYGRKHTPDTLQKILPTLKLGVTPEANKKRAKSLSQRWQNAEFASSMRTKMLASLMKKPTTPERRVIEAINTNKYPFRYVGDGSYLIGSLNPDFIATDGSQKLIEVFGRVFHDPKQAFMKVPFKGTEEGRRAYFAKQGWDALILWDDEVFSDSFNIAEAIGGFIDG